MDTFYIYSISRYSVWLYKHTLVTQTFLTHIWTVSRCTLASLPPPLTIITNHFRTNVRIWRGLTRWPESKIAKWRSVCPSEFSWRSLRPQTDPDLKRLMNTKAKDKILFFPAGNFREMRSVPLAKIFSISPSTLTVWVLITRWLIMFPSIVTSYNKRVLKTFNFFDKTHDKMVNQQGTLCLKKVSNIKSFEYKKFQSPFNLILFPWEIYLNVSIRFL